MPKPLVVVGVDLVDLDGVDVAAFKWKSFLELNERFIAKPLPLIKFVLKRQRGLPTLNQHVLFERRTINPDQY